MKTWLGAFDGQGALEHIDQGLPLVGPMFPSGSTVDRCRAVCQKIK
jgi:hypothetical protein